MFQKPFNHRSFTHAAHGCTLDLDNTLLDGDNKRGIGHGESVHDMDGTVMSSHCNAALSEKREEGGGRGKESPNTLTTDTNAPETWDTRKNNVR